VTGRPPILDRGLAGRLAELLGPDNFSLAGPDLLAASLDASDLQHRPQAVAWPLNRDQVAGVLSLASAHRLPVTPRGAGTGLTGGALAVRGGLVLDLCRMNRIKEISIPDRLAVVEPGCVYADLDRALAPHGFFFPPDPASGQSCTLGGNVATNAGGIRGAKYGTTRDYVLGLEVVLADGRVLKTGSRTMKCVSGLDLTRLFVGSEGILGVISEITFKIDPRPPARATAAAFFGELAQAGRAVTGVIESGIVPAVLEALDGRCISLLIDLGGLDLPRTQAMLLAETDAFSQAEADLQLEKVVEVFRRAGALEVRLARDREEAAGLWLARRSIGPLAINLKPNGLVEDVTVPISRLPELMEGVARIGAEHELLIINFGHAGDGNLHPQIMYDRADPAEAERVEAAAAEILALACRLQGTLSGEHGLGLTKAPFVGLEHGPVELEMMAALKATFDPLGILNPGKMGIRPKIP